MTGCTGLKLIFLEQSFLSKMMNSRSTHLALAVERSEENTKSLHRKCCKYSLLFRYFHINTLGPKSIYIAIYVKINLYL